MRMARRVGAYVLSICLLLGGAASARATSWTVDPQKSRIGFNGTQTGQQFSGEFDRYSANIVFDPLTPAAGHAEIQIKTCSAHTGDTQRDSAMPGPDWFNCSVMPQAVFKIVHFASLGGAKFTGTGTLTIRGISRPVSLPFTFLQTGAVAHVTGGVDLVRTDYGVGQGVWSDGSWVGLKVAVTIDLIANEQGT